MFTLFDAIKAVDLVLRGKDEDSDKSEVLFSQGSMTKLVSKFIITPTIIVSESAKDNNTIKELIEYNVSLFASLYTQVFVTLVHIHGLKPNVAFELLSSDFETIYTKNSALEEFSYDALLVGQEDDNFFLPGLEGDDKKKKKRTSKRKISINKDKNESHISKLVTREIEISIETDKRTILIPAMIRANVVYVKPTSIANMIGKENKETLLDRIDDYRAGAITLGDLVFANDLINDYEKRRLKDREDLIREMRTRELTSASKLLKHGAAGYSRLYQMIIMTTDDEMLVSKQLRGTLAKPRVKEEFLDATASLSASVIDLDYERVSIYVNDIKGSIDLSYKEISKKEKNGDSMEELLKLLTTTRSI